MRFTRPLSLALALGLGVGVASAAAPAKGSGGGKSGTTTIGGNAIDATPNSPDKGTFTFNDTNRASYTADLDCVRVEGNTTYFSGVIRVASKVARTLLGILPGFTYVYGEFVDGGEPEADSFEVLILNPDGSEDPAAHCETNRDGSVYDMTNGNLQVQPGI